MTFLSLFPSLSASAARFNLVLLADRWAALSLLFKWLWPAATQKMHISCVLFGFNTSAEDGRRSGVRRVGTPEGVFLYTDILGKLAVLK